MKFIPDLKNDFAEKYKDIIGDVKWQKIKSLSRIGGNIEFKENVARDLRDLYLSVDIDELLCTTFLDSPALVKERFSKVVSSFRSECHKHAISLIDDQAKDDDHLAALDFVFMGTLDIKIKEVVSLDDRMEKELTAIGARQKIKDRMWKLENKLSKL